MYLVDGINSFIHLLLTLINTLRSQIQQVLSLYHLEAVALEEVFQAVAVVEVLVLSKENSTQPLKV